VHSDLNPWFTKHCFIYFYIYSLLCMHIVGFSGILSNWKSRNSVISTVYGDAHLSVVTAYKISYIMYIMYL